MGIRLHPRDTRRYANEAMTENPTYHPQHGMLVTQPRPALLRPRQLQSGRRG